MARPRAVPFLYVPNREFARAPTRVLFLAAFPPNGRSDGWGVPPWCTRTRTPGSRGRWRPPSSTCRPTPSRSAGSARRPASARSRGRRPLPPAPALPELRGGVALKGRPGTVWRPTVALPLVQCVVHVPHWHLPRGLQEAPRDLGRLHQPDDVRSAARRLRRGLPHKPPHDLGVAPSPVRGGRLPPGPHRAARARLDRRDVRQRHGPLPWPRANDEAGSPDRKYASPSGSTPARSRWLWPASTASPRPLGSGRS